ncbi:elongation of very long chain fatty acids protein 4-like [Daktulosphaira vitifoliae]|uniref:elongation of very long chain fatty acids protein 4-like n=1 Tax=Daktulosphaira vitifoliae TaxID=58002 RepID=UPI0021A9DD15|nr:elongation of very long chain fatty acids protein 4-like [Daktulosphaira vitifoliae]
MLNMISNNLNCIMKNALDQISIILREELKFDEKVDSWPLMKTPWPIFSILLIYALIVLKIGPKLMENRKPFNLKSVMVAYNLLQALYNCYLISGVFTVPKVIPHIVYYSCHPVISENYELITQKFYLFTWHFIITKIFDLSDTVFFVLRKKQSHISFLHVYHHMNMVITSWIFLRYIKAHNGIFCGLLNSFVHVVMYSYYFLAALGPLIQKYLWWKIYITRLQIIQFIIGLLYMAYLVINNCTFPKIFSFYMTVDVLLFLYLFLKFYKKTYSEKTKDQ